MAGQLIGGDSKATLIGAAIGRRGLNNAKTNKVLLKGWENEKSYSCYINGSFPIHEAEDFGIEAPIQEPGRTIRVQHMPKPSGDVASKN